MPLFSVIIPTRNRPDYLAEAVASVLAQSEHDFELLIVNDGVPLESPPRDRHVRILENEARGAVPARKLGVAQALGQFVAFLDDDDQWIDRDHLKRSAAVLKTESFAFGDGLMQFPGEAHPRLFDRDADAASLARDNTILISAVCYRRRLHDALGAFDETLPYYWDWDWYLRVARAGHVLHHMNHAVADIRIHPQNMSGEMNREARRDNLDRLSAKHGLGFITLRNHTDFV